MGISRFTDVSHINFDATKLRLLMNELGDELLLQTEEDLNLAFSNFIQKYNKHKDTPFFSPCLALKGDIPDAAKLSYLFKDISKDIEVLYQELFNLRTIFTNNFNTIAIKESGVRKTAQRIQSLLSTFKIFNVGLFDNYIVFSDSFNLLEHIDVSSPLLTKQENVILEDEGVVVLPFTSSDIETKEITSISINSSSNGQPGSSVLGQPFNGDVRRLIDNNADTWFEYEKIIDANLENGLVFDFTAILKEESIINRIDFLPIYFNNQLWPYVEVIGTSLNGEGFTNIKNDIIIKDWTLIDKRDALELSPGQSKFSGNLAFSFSPRKAKFVRIRVRQPQAYEVEVSSGKSLRYAIGLKEIKVFSIKYKEEGEVVSKRWQSTQEINKVALITNQFPVDELEPFGRIEHFISPDDGVSWHLIKPLNIEAVQESEEIDLISNFYSIAINHNILNDLELARVVEFNTDEVSIKTPIPVTSLRYKALFKRESQKFQSGLSFRKEIVRTSTAKTISDRQNFISVDDSIYRDANLMIPIFKIGGKTIIGTTGSGGKLIGGAEKFLLPITLSSIRLDNFQPEVDKYFSFYLILGDSVRWNLAPGTDWGQTKPGVATFDGSVESSSTWEPNLFKDSTSRHFRIEDNSIIFGNGTFPSGAYPDPEMTLDHRKYGGLRAVNGQAITMVIPPEPLVFSSVKPYKAKTLFPSIKDLNATSIKRLEPIIRTNTETLNIQDPRFTLHTIEVQDTSSGVALNELLTSTISIAGYTLVDFIDGSTEFLTRTTENIFSVQSEDRNRDPINPIIYFPSTPGVISITYKTISITTLKSGIDFSFDNSDRESKTLEITPDAYISYRSSDPINIGITTITLGHGTIDTGIPLNSLSEFAIEPGSIEIPRDNNNKSLFSALEKEIPFINGIKEFTDLRLNNVDVSGTYSVDYRQAKVYSSSTISGPIGKRIEYKYTLYSIGYIAAYTTRDSDYQPNFTINKDKFGITFKPGFVIDVLPGLLKLAKNFGGITKIEYDTLKDVQEDIKALEPHYSPILREYALLAEPVQRIFLPHTEIFPLPDLKESFCAQQPLHYIQNITVDSIDGTTINASLIGRHFRDGMVVYANTNLISSVIETDSRISISFSSSIANSPITFKVSDLVCEVETTFTASIIEGI